MEIIARAVGRRKEAVAQVQIIRGTGQFVINTKAAHEYLQNDSCAILAVQAPFDIFQKNGKINGQIIGKEQTNNLSTDLEEPLKQSTETVSKKFLETVDTLVTVKGGGLKGQTEAIRLGIARALCLLETSANYSLVRNAKPSFTDSSSGQDDVNQIEESMTQTSDSSAQVLETVSNSEAEVNSAVELKKQLKDKGFLTQDSRVKERRKYGLKKARKASQYHKR
jgi:small subunit ribosomal protein S9